MEKYRELEVFEYEKAIKLLLSEELEFLKAIYNFPNHTASKKEMEQLNFLRVNLTVGGIGKKISESAGVAHPDYKKDINPKGGYEREAYFMFIGPYYKEEGRTKGTKNGWQMKDNLCEAMRSLGYVK